MIRKRTDAERAKAYVMRTLNVSPCRNIKDTNIDQIITHFNMLIADACLQAINAIGKEASIQKLQDEAKMFKPGELR